MITHQRITSGGELYTDLVAASGVKPNANKTLFAAGDPCEFQTGTLHTLPFPLDHKNLVLFGVLPEKILPVRRFRWGAVDHGNIFLHHLPILNSLAQGGGSLPCPGIDHDSTHIFVQTVDGENFASKDFFQFGGNFGLRIKANRLDTDRKGTVGIENGHGRASCVDIEPIITQICGIYKENPEKSRDFGNSCACNSDKIRV